MKTMKMLSKRYLAMLLVFAMCFSMMHLSVYAAETEPDIDFTLTVGEDTEDLRESDKISDYLTLTPMCSAGRPAISLLPQWKTAWLPLWAPELPRLPARSA